MDAAGDITGLLTAARNGDARAADRLAVLIYDELRRLALAHGAGVADTLSATALVHETWLRIFGNHEANFADRRHFYAYAAQAMRRIVVDHARRRGARKRGGGAERATFDDSVAATAAAPEQIVALDQALTRLHALDARLARLVELRVFAGLEGVELAAVLKVSERTVKRDWRRARTLLGTWLTGVAG